MASPLLSVHLINTRNDDVRSLDIKFHYNRRSNGRNRLQKEYQIRSCPYCHRSCPCAGRFADQETDHIRSSPQRPESVLKRAATNLIKRLRRGQFSRKLHSNKSDPGTEVDWRYTSLPELPTMGDPMMDDPVQLPCPGDDYYMSFRKQTELASWEPNELGGPDFAELPVQIQDKEPDTTRHLDHPTQNVRMSFKNPYTNDFDAGEPLQPFSTGWPGIASGMSPATSFSAPIPYSFNEEKGDSQRQDLSRTKSHSYNPILDTEVHCQPSPAVWSGTANGTMHHQSPTTSISTSNTYSSNDEERFVRGWDSSRNQSQGSFISQDQSSVSPDSMIMFQQSPLDTTQVRAQVSPVSPGTGTTVISSDLSSDPVGLLSSSSTSLNRTDVHALRSPVNFPADCLMEPSGEPSSPDVPEDASTLELSPRVTGSSLSCEFCGQTFHASRHARANLKRHKIQKHSHSGDWKHRCDKPNCGEIFPRSDYLKIHNEKVHRQVIHKVTRRRIKKLNSG